MIEAGDHHAAADGEGDGLAALAGGVELLAILEGADVVDGHLVALLDGLLGGGGEAARVGTGNRDGRPERGGAGRGEVPGAEAGGGAREGAAGGEDGLHFSLGGVGYGLTGAVALPESADWRRLAIRFGYCPVKPLS